MAVVAVVVVAVVGAAVSLALRLTDSLPVRLPRRAGVSDAGQNRKQLRKTSDNHYTLQL